MEASGARVRLDVAVDIEKLRLEIREEVGNCLLLSNRSVEWGSQCRDGWKQERDGDQLVGIGDVSP